MPLRKGVPYRHSPTTVCDTLDGSTADPGAMSLLQNLVPDPSTKNSWVSRPAAMQLTGFAGFTTPGFISVLKIYGTLAVGMVASARFAGKDEPFVYNLAAGSFVTVSGVASTNVPSSPVASGAWTPPAMDLIGTKATLAHPGFDGVTLFVGWLDISNPSAPAWSAGNTSGTPLPVPPVSVAQFGQRAYYLVNPPTGQPAAIATDVLDPTKRTNATYVLTFGDNIPLTAAFGLPLNTTLGGIVQSLMVFKGTKAIWQVTGDFSPATVGQSDSSVQANALNVATGTLAPNSICATPKGIMFMSPEGIRLIDFQSQVSMPMGEGGKGITLPFSNAAIPTRVAAACNSNVLRVTTQNAAVLSTPVQEWWYHLNRDCWSGPHTFPASLYGVFNDSFIITPNGITASLWQSDSEPSAATTYTENGNAMTFQYQTALLPVRTDMNECSMAETVLYIGFSTGAPCVAVLTDQNGSVIPGGQVTLPAASAVGATWGSFAWGRASWGASASMALAAHELDWTQPIVFDRMQLRVQGQCAQGVKLGDCYMRYQPLGYLSRAS